MGKLIEVMLIYEDARNLGCAWLFMVHLDLEIWFVACNLCAWWLVEDEDKI
jgi:hypothetical protein